MKFICWKYVVPRLTFVLIVALVIRFGLDPALKWAMVSGGEAMVGAKVEVGVLKTALKTGELVVTDLAVANPRAPMRNLVETCESRLLLDTNALLHGRVVITEGTLSGLQFDTDRQSSGAVERAELATDEGPSAFQPWIASGKEQSAQWLDNLGDRLSIDLVDQLQTPRLAAELENRWPQQYQSLREQVDSLQQQSKAIEESMRSVRDNPLRNFQQLGGLHGKLATMQQQTIAIQQQIAELPHQAERDREAVLAARQQDETFLRQQLQFGKIDGEGLTQTLLGAEATKSLSNALKWVSWARSQLPERSDRQQAIRRRGTTVVFTPPRPRYWIQQLQLSGSTQLGGESLQLVGTLTDACSEPQLLNEPTRLALSGSGATDLGVEITLDRRGGVSEDRFLLRCPRLAMPARMLGSDRLSVEVAPGSASVKVDLVLTDEKLGGNIEFAQGAVQLAPNTRPGQNEHLHELLSRALSSVDRVDAKVLLSGTLKKPQMKIESDLGTQLAAGVNTAMHELLRQHTDQLLAETREEVDQRMARLTELRTQAQQELLAKLGQGQKVLEQLAALQPSGGRLPTIPTSASFSQPGKSLHPDTQRK